MLRGLKLILTTIIAIFVAFIHSLGHDLATPTVELPIDIRTVYSICNLEPHIIRTPCCPKCFSTFPVNAVPSTCPWRKNAKRGKRCGEPLLCNRQTRKGPKKVPKTFISTQSFESWLQSFLSRSDIEEHLKTSFQKTVNADHVDVMHDISDSPAWQTFRRLLRSHYSLIFGLYIDWFNPFTNKTAGMSLKN
jgi:hypothetical protein